MAPEKSLKLNKSRTEEFLKSPGKDSSQRTTLVLQAITVSLIAHIFILFITQMLTQDNRLTENKVVLMPLEMELAQESPEENPAVPAEQTPRSGALKNLIANENAQRTSDEKSYRGMSKDQMNEQVFNDLKQMEAEEFAKLNEGRPDGPTVNSRNSEEKSSPKKPSDYDWYKTKANNTSYSGNVSAAYNMQGRDAIDNPTPTYRCKRQGQVVVNVEINALGQVTNASIDNGKSSIDDCLRTESEKYARLWKFNYAAGGKKQNGTITFTFSAQ